MSDLIIVHETDAVVHDAIILRARTSTGPPVRGRVAGQCAIVQGTATRATADTGPVTDQRAIVQGAESRPAAGVKRRVAGQRAVVQRAAIRPSARAALVYSTVQGEAREAGPVGQMHTSESLKPRISTDGSELWTVDAAQAQ